MELDCEVIVKHTYREANQLVDALARHSYFLSDIIVILRIARMILSTFWFLMRRGLSPLGMYFCSFLSSGLFVIKKKKLFNKNNSIFFFRKLIKITLITYKE
jgi:hypothetical protein